MKKHYKTELEAMGDFYEELGITPDYSCNTDGRVGGTLVEFKLNNIEGAPIEQLKGYVKSYNSAALPIPRYSLFIAVNQKEYMFIDNDGYDVVIEGSWEEPEDLLRFLDKSDYLNGWINETSIVAYNDLFYSKHFTASKDAFIEEMKNPKELNIEPYNWNKTGEMEREILDCLGGKELKKRLGAFFTPDEYVKISTEYLRNAIARVPEGYDYIILDRCAGTGNLEKFLTKNELSHCVLNTCVYAEWTTLTGVYGGKVRHIIPHTKDHKDSDGLLRDGDALTEEFDKLITKVIANEKKNAGGKLVVIGMENPPYAEPGAKTNSGLKTAGSFVNVEMKKDEKVKGRASTDLSNQFIWSMEKYADEYIVFAPIKYWKSQHLFEGRFNEGYLCNRKKFHATEAAISLISWTLDGKSTNDFLDFQSDLGNKKVTKVHKGINALAPSNTKKEKIAEVYFYNGEPNYLNGVLCNNPMNKNACHRILGDDNIFQTVPLWVANCYKPKNYTEIGVLLKSSDNGADYQKDKNFLDDCFVWACLTNRNCCVSTNQAKNEMCLGQNTEADALLNISARHTSLLKKWRALLKEAKNTSEYNSHFTYGLHQICKEINVKIEIGKNKRGEPIKAFKHPKLNADIKEFKVCLDEFYDKHITDKLFSYQLLK